MGLKISATLKKAIASERGIEPAEVEDHVWAQKPHSCFLCGDSLNRSSDSIELDHHEPASEGGDNSWKNLNLTHSECNRYKRNHSSIDVRPHLHFKRFWEKSAGAVNFKNAKAFYNMNKSDCFLQMDHGNRSVTLTTPDGEANIPFFSEDIGGSDLLFCFADIPISCVENDDAIQPRNIQLNHLLSIASDLKKNPLHEQPACRIVGQSDKKEILMFDGQHKTVAKMMNGASSAVFKVYLDINEQQAIHLVNSIQSRIKKLPLTPFELASKMSDEVARRIAEYEEDVESPNVSEAGFINWLDPAERARAKKGIESAVIDQTIGNEQLDFRKIIERKGLAIEGPISLREAAFQSQILKKLLYVKPLPESYKGEAMKQARERETSNVIRLLNTIYDRGFTVQADAEPETENKRIDRLKYQASLAYMSVIFRQLVSSQVFPTRDEYTFFEKDIPEEVWDRVAGFIEQFFGHPIWTADLEKGSKTKAVQEALSKNQNYEAAFREVGLTGGYCAGQDKLPTNWAGS